MTSMNTRSNIEKLDRNIIQKHGSSKQVGFKQLGHKQAGDREAEVFQVSNDDTAVAQRWLEDKLPEEKTNTNCLVKEREKVHLGIKVGANITVTGVPGQNGAEGGPQFEVPALDEDAEYRDREAEVFQVSNDDAAMPQRWVGANITVTGVPGQEGAEGAEGNVDEKKNGSFES
ncbi:hypothetical protein Tco_0419389 [Tanacetum coccineum]